MNFHLRPYNQYILNIVTNIYLGLDYYKKINYNQSDPVDYSFFMSSHIF